MKELLMIFLIYPLITFGQVNLVPNPSFEDGVCPDLNSYYNSQNGNMEDVDYWVNGNIHSADYYNTCAEINQYSIPNNPVGYQMPLSGYSYCGIFSYNINSDTREYIYTFLDEPLIKDKEYSVGFYFSTTEFTSRTTTSIGLHFFNNEPDTNSLLPLYDSEYLVNNIECIDSINTIDWILVEGTYTAKGNENFIAIGCFESNDFVEEHIIENDNSIFTGQTYLLIDNVFIYELNGEEQQDSTNVSIEENQLVTNVYPNPTFGELNVNIESSEAEFELFNTIGELLEKHQLQKGNNTLNLKTNTNGVYFYRITENGTITKTNKLLLQ